VAPVTSLAVTLVSPRRPRSGLTMVPPARRPRAITREPVRAPTGATPVFVANGEAFLTSAG
jgi:hypothetical protein